MRRPLRTRTFVLPTTLWIGEDGVVGFTIDARDGLMRGDVVSMSMVDPGDATVTRMGWFRWTCRRVSRRRRRRRTLGDLFVESPEYKALKARMIR